MVCHLRKCFAEFPNTLNLQNFYVVGLTSIRLRVFLFHTPVSQQRGSKDAEFCRCCRLSPFRVFKAVEGQISYGFLKKPPKMAPAFNTENKAMDSPQTLQQCCLVNLHPQPPVSPAWPVSSSVSRLDSPWFAVWNRPPFTGMSERRGPRPPVIGLDPSVLVPWLAAQSSSLYGDYLIKELMSRNVWAAEEEAESTNRFCGHIKKLLPHPLGASHWVLKSLGCLIVRFGVMGEKLRETPTYRDSFTLMATSRRTQLFLPKVCAQAV